MNKLKNRHRSHKIERIERKCDRILSELLILRRHLIHRPDMDAAIDRLHHAARVMRAQCERERDIARKMFNSSFPE